jgi:hypothetical protein
VLRCTRAVVCATRLWPARVRARCSPTHTPLPALRSRYAAICSSYMGRLDLSSRVWHACEGPRLSRLHAAVAGASGASAAGGALACVTRDVCAVALLAALLAWCERGASVAN